MVELVTDLQLRSVGRFQVADVSEVASGRVSLRHLAASSKYGIAIALVGKNKLRSWKSAELNGSAAGGNQPPSRREIVCPFNAQGEVVSVDVSADGVVLALCVNTANGPFAHLFDVRCFSPLETEQPFPLAAIRLSTNSSAAVVCFEWNPCPSPPIFVASTSDHNLLCIQYDFESGSAFTILGSTATKSLVECASWSPKGKQLSAGDSEGRILQYKPELAPVRTLDPPAPAARCIALSWLATTEWLAAYLLPDSRVVVSLVVQKKGQSQQWMPYPTLNLVSIAGTAPPSVAFLPVLEWRMVFVYSTRSSTVDVVGLHGENWVRFEFDNGYDIQLPPLEGTNAETFPVGACLDLTSTKTFDVGRRVSAQPCILLLTAHGLLTSYGAVSLSTQRPTITKAAESYQVGQARFGNPPPGYQPPKMALPQPQAAPAVAATPGPLPKSAPAAPTLTTSAPAVRPLATATSVTASPISVEAREAAERARQQELDRIKWREVEAFFKQSVSDYCRARNAQASRVDTLRELRGKVEESASTMNNEDEIDSLFESIISIYHSLEDAECDLDTTRSRLLRSTEFVSDVKIAEKEGRDKSRELRDNSGDSPNVTDERANLREATFAKLQKGRVELLRERFEMLVDKVEGVRKGLEALNLDGGDGQRKLTSWQPHTALLPEEQAEFNRISGEVAKGIRKLSTRLTHLQQKVRFLGAVRDAKDEGSKSTEGQDDSGLDQVEAYAAKMAEVLLVSPPTPHGSRRLNSSTPGSDKLPAERTSRLRQVLKSLANLPVTKVPCQFPSQSTSAVRGQNQLAKGADSSAEQRGVSSESDIAIASRLAQAIYSTPRKASTVSIGTQSPEWRKGAVTGRSSQAASATPLAIPPTARAVQRMPEVPAPSIVVHSPQATPKTTVADAATPLKTPQLERAAVPLATEVATTTAPTVPKPVSIETPLVHNQPPALKVEAAQSSAPAPTIASTTASKPVAPAVSTSDQKPVLFSFKPPSTTSAATASTTTASTANFHLPVAPPTTTTTVGNDDGMMEEEPTATAAPNISFSFKQTGLGSSTPLNQNASPFGGLNLANRAQTQSSGSGSSWPFGAGAGVSTQSATTGTLFQSPSSNAPAVSPSFGAFGQSKTATTTTVNSPFGGAGNRPAFGGGATFGTASPFGSDSASNSFGAGQSITNSSVQPPQQGGLFGNSKPAFGTAGTTAAGSSSGFTAFANRSSAFGQLAQNSSPPQQQPTSPFGGMNQSGGGGFGGFGAPSSANLSGFTQQTGSTLHSSPAFTMMRK